MIRRHFLPLVSSLALWTALPGIAVAASLDGTVEWAGLSHQAFQDRRPLCPVANETFAVRFQAWANDLAGARVRLSDGATVTWVSASKVGTRGPSDIWQAQLPATTTTTPSYYIEVSDGADTDYVSVGGVTDAPPADGGWALNFSTYAHAPVGVTPTTGGGAAFNVWSPTTSSATVRGSFNGWGSGNALGRVGENWIGRVSSGVPVGAEYKFYFNNSVWNTDPRARGLDAGNGPYNAIVANPFAYVWHDASFVTPPLDQMVIYQLHVGTYSGRNDPIPGAAFPGRYIDVAARVGHLVDLGVNAVMLNPITEFPGDESAGYNPITAWSPEWKYGTPDQCKAMIDSLHAHGIAVILDIVWNHMSPTDNFLWNYDGTQQWFDNPAVQTPWGSQCDFDKTAVRDYYVQSALSWLEEFHVDGFRMDATDYMNIAPQDAAGWALMQRFNDELDRRWADKVTIAEQLPNDSYVTRPTSLGGAGFDSQYQDAFTDNLRQEIFDAATGDPEMWKIRDAINGSGSYINGVSATNYFELHDEAWPSSGGQRAVKTIDTTAPSDDIYAQGRTKLAQGLTLTAPGVPAFLMGAEWLEDTDFGASSTNRIDWSKQTTYAPYYSWFKAMVALRRGTPAFRAGATWSVYHFNESGNVLAFRRTDATGASYVVIANFSNTNYGSYRLGMPVAGGWTEAIDSQSAKYGGNGLDNPGTLQTQAVAYDGYAQSLVVSVPQMALIVLAPPAVVGVTPRDTDGDSALGLTVRAEPHGVLFEYRVPAPGAVRLDLFDLTGRQLAGVLHTTAAAGTHAATWNGRRDDGRAAPAGVYLARLTQGDTAIYRRVVLTR